MVEKVTVRPINMDVIDLCDSPPMSAREKSWAKFQNLRKRKLQEQEERLKKQDAVHSEIGKKRRLPSNTAHGNTIPFIRLCSSCNEEKTRENYSKNQLRKGNGISKCKTCVEQSQKEQERNNQKHNKTGERSSQIHDETGIKKLHHEISNSVSPKQKGSAQNVIEIMDDSDTNDESDTNDQPKAISETTSQIEKNGDDDESIEEEVEILDRPKKMRFKPNKKFASTRKDPITIDESTDSTMTTNQFTTNGLDSTFIFPVSRNTETRFIFHKPVEKPPSVRTVKPKRDTWSYCVSNEDAVKEQERLLKASAARIRSNQTHQFRVTTPFEDKVKTKKTMSFSVPVMGIDRKYPGHWLLEDPYARLGLPPGASPKLVKAQYRALALVYHPDKSTLENTAIKFQAVTEAYRAILKR